MRIPYHTPPADIFVNLRTGYINEDTMEEETDFRLIAKSYLQSYFTVDFISSIPFDMILEATSTDGGEGNRGGGGGAGFTKILKIFRLLKLAKLVKVL